MTRLMEHSEGFLQARAAAENVFEPDWPETIRCRRCGADTWRVVTPDGDDLVLDTELIEVELGGRCDGDVFRAPASFIWKEARRVDGWRLEDPVEGIVGWLWGATAAPLAQALAEPLFSEHVYTCSHASEREVRSLVADSERRARIALGQTTSKASTGSVAPKRPLASKQTSCIVERCRDRSQPLAAQQPSATPQRMEQLALWGT